MYTNSNFCANVTARSYKETVPLINLGIYLSHDLHWNVYVNEITNKTNKTQNFLRHS